jgi:IS30 family transposase
VSTLFQDGTVSRQGKEEIVVFVEHKLRFYIAIEMKDKNAGEIFRADVKALGSLPSRLRRSITFDNGLENTLHEKINAALGTRSYFCRPYRSWEKGSIEDRNGILRRYFPQKAQAAKNRSQDCGLYHRHKCAVFLRHIYFIFSIDRS